MTDIAFLIEQQSTTDAFGDQVYTETHREVFCEVASVGMHEFYQAHAVGLQPELKLILQDYLDYEGELFIEHNSQRYHILRTYRTGQKLELVCTREVNP